MIIAGLQKTTLIDYPGKIGTIVFLAGCNFRCDWCYSAELVLPKKIKNQPKISEEEFFNFLKSRQGLVDGVSICGGEPTINNDLPDFIKRIKELGFLVKLDTNGSNPEMLNQLIKDKLVDYVAMDVKLPKDKYSRVFFGDIKVEDIQKSIDILKEDKVDYEFRTTMVPEILEKKDIINIAQWISGSKRYYLQNFRAEKTLDPQFEEKKPYSEEYLLEIKKEISSLFNICDIR